MRSACSTLSPSSEVKLRSGLCQAWGLLPLPPAFSDTLSRFRGFRGLEHSQSMKTVPTLAVSLSWLTVWSRQRRADPPVPSPAPSAGSGFCPPSSPVSVLTATGEQSTASQRTQTLWRCSTLTTPRASLQYFLRQNGKPAATRVGPTESQVPESDIFVSGNKYPSYQPPFPDTSFLFQRTAGLRPPSKPGCRADNSSERINNSVLQGKAMQVFVAQDKS